MRSPEVIIFSKHKALAILAIEHLSCLEAANIRIFASMDYSMNLEFPAFDLNMVVCDFFYSFVENKLFRKLYEHNTNFSTLNKSGLEAFVARGVNRFAANSVNVLGERYSGLSAQPQMDNAIRYSLLQKVFNCNVRGQQIPDRVSIQKPNASPSKTKMIDALESRQVVPYFQPKICLMTNRLLGVEVLARWHHPENGVLPPDTFLPLVDKYHLHQILLTCLLEQALHVQQILRSMGETLIFAFNVDATQLTQEGFASWLINKVQQVGAPLSQITLEITETSNLNVGMQSIENVTRLTGSGVNLSLDDFGTGYSSIQRLAQLPFNQIKLDPTFIGNATDEKMSRIIVCIIELARSLEIEVVAEGVETEQQRLYLKTLGVNSAQGYLFHKPMCGAALIELLQGTM